MNTKTTEMVYQACPSCKLEYLARPKVILSEKYTDLCKLCLEEALEQESDDDE